MPTHPTLHPTVAVTLSEEDILFMQRGVSIHAASRDTMLRPAAMTACGCRVAADRAEITVFVNADHAPRVLENLSRTRVIAVNFARPSDLRAIQIKGVDARETPILPGDLDLIGAYRESFVADMALLDFSETYSLGFIPLPNDSLTAVTFTPIQAFNQTPGQHAGQPLK